MQPSITPAPSKCRLSRLYKSLTLIIFFIMPKKISNLFINLSIMAAIYNVRNIDFCTDNFNTSKINVLLQVAISNDMLLLPHYTVNWFWDDDFLNSPIIINDDVLTLKNIIIDKELFFKHISLVVNSFIKHIPTSLIIKTNLDNMRNRLILKHNIVNILLYS